MMIRYILRRGDTLSLISRCLEITLAELLEINPEISNPNLVFSGQTILIPNSILAKQLHSKIANVNIDIDLPHWLKVAFREEGVTEYAGNIDNNPIIVDYHLSTSLKKKDALLDETPWCSSFVNWCMIQSGFKGTNSAWALNWRNWKYGEKIQNSKVGSIVVFSRTYQGREGGHVGFFIRETSERILVLGGNQSNTVKMSWYPKDGSIGGTEYKLRAYIWPKDN